MPDILSKVTYDRDFSGRHFHAELTGLFRGAHASVTPIASSSFQTHTAFSGGGQIAANCDLLPKLVLLANAFWSDGGGRYLVATGPDLVFRPNSAGTDVSLSMVHWIQTFWSEPRYGAVQSYVPYSYRTRAPRFVAPDTPENARLSMVYFGFPYVLPTTAGTLARVPRPD